MCYVELAAAFLPTEYSQLAKANLIQISQTNCDQENTLLNLLTLNPSSLLCQWN